ncbi:low temperature requirement protein A [Microbacterium sp.]|uniref:low temperature requirement protein A n=1 Tax=Microbacterium sp. TaxID=51671 RepID=UPI003C7308DF
MTPRAPGEPHRVASPLELFFDLVFVVAVSLSSGELHHGEAEGHIGLAVGSYLAVFFAVWWAWMNFTWFASAFDTDDWAYRVLTVVQMAGALVMAAGTPAAMNESDWLVVTLGYVLMRLAMVAQWLRAAAASPELRATALRYAGGIAVVQVLWVLRLLLPDQGGLPAFLLLVVLELAVPPFAERAGRTPWHPHHIAERYSLFTLIVLGESILASTTAVVDAVSSGDRLGTLLLVAACGLVLAASMWWVYFAGDGASRLTSHRRAIALGYGHYVILAAAGAFSAGVSVIVAYDTHAADLAAAAAAASLTVPVAVFFTATWALLLRGTVGRGRSALVLVLSVAVGASALLPASLPITLPIAAALAIALVVVVESGRGVAAVQPGSHTGA